MEFLPIKREKSSALEGLHEKKITDAFPSLFKKKKDSLKKMRKKCSKTWPVVYLFIHSQGETLGERNRGKCLSQPRLL